MASATTAAPAPSTRTASTAAIARTAAPVPGERRRRCCRRGHPRPRRSRAASSLVWTHAPRLRLSLVAHITCRTASARTVGQAPPLPGAGSVRTARTAARAARTGHLRRHRVRPSAATGCPSTWCSCSTTRGVWRPSRPRCLSLRPISSSNLTSAQTLRAWGSWSLIRRPPSCRTFPPIPMRCSRHWPMPSKPVVGLPSAAVSRLGLPSSRRVGAGAHGPRCYSC